MYKNTILYICNENIILFLNYYSSFTKIFFITYKDKNSRYALVSAVFILTDNKSFQSNMKQKNLGLYTQKILKHYLLNSMPINKNQLIIMIFCILIIKYSREKNLSPYGLRPTSWCTLRTLRLKVQPLCPQSLKNIPLLY